MWCPCSWWRTVEQNSCTCIPKRHTSIPSSPQMYRWLSPGTGSSPPFPAWHLPDRRCRISLSFPVKLPPLFQTWHNSDRHVTGFGVFAFQKRVDAVFQVSAEFCLRQPYHTHFTYTINQSIIILSEQMQKHCSHCTSIWGDITCRVMTVKK